MCIAFSPSLDEALPQTVEHVVSGCACGRPRAPDLRWLPRRPVARPGHLFCYNDKEIMRAFADQSAPTYEFPVAHGVVFVEKAPDNSGAGGFSLHGLARCVVQGRLAGMNAAAEA